MRYSLTTASRSVFRQSNQGTDGGDVRTEGETKKGCYGYSTAAPTSDYPNLLTLQTFNLFQTFKPIPLSTLDRQGTLPHTDHLNTNTQPRRTITRPRRTIIENLDRTTEQAETLSLNHDNKPRSKPDLKRVPREAMVTAIKDLTTEVERGDPQLWPATPCKITGCCTWRYAEIG